MRAARVVGAWAVILAVLGYVGWSLEEVRAIRAFPEADLAWLDARRDEGRLPRCYGPLDLPNLDVSDAALDACFGAATLAQQAFAGDTLLLAYGCDAPGFSAHITFKIARTGGPNWCNIKVAETCDALPSAFGRNEALWAPGLTPTWLTRALVE